LKLLCTTNRLKVYTINEDTLLKEKINIISNALDILTIDVVKNLPDSFKNITTIEQCTTWFNTTLSNNNFYTIHHRTSNNIIGYIFTSKDNTDINIGYLLAKNYWHQGFASEVLSNFIKLPFIQKYNSLLAGVDINNTSSSKLLIKLGFKKQDSYNDTIFYKYTILTVVR
jgi:ribosomal-protein-alanine N-acetyltransferase